MAYYFCIAEGMADCSPTTQDFYCVETPEEFAETVEAACKVFENLDAESGFWNEEKRETIEPAGRLPIRYAFRMPREGEDNYSQRVCISRFSDNVLDVIGMTESDYARETSDIDDRETSGGIY